MSVKQGRSGGAIGKERQILSAICGHLTASAGKCIRNPIQSESKSESKSNICTGQMGGGELHLAQNLKYLREQKGMSQRECAENFGLSSSAIAMWEQDQRKPDIDMLIRLTEYFGVTLDDMVLKDLRPPIPLYISNVKYLRKKRGMTQGEMAVLLGFKGKSSLCAVETGKVALSIENLEKLADFFGVTLDQLVKQDLSKEQ